MADNLELGREYLLEIQEDVAKWQHNAEQFSYAAALASVTRINAKERLDQLVLSATFVSDLSTTLYSDEFDKFAGEIARAEVARQTYARLQQIKAGRSIPKYDYKEHATIKVTEAGAGVYASYFGDPFRGYLINRKRREVEPGEQLRGRVNSLDTAPEAGGRLEIVKPAGVMVVEGLINPADNTPRVELTVFSRSRNSHPPQAC